MIDQPHTTNANDLDDLATRRSAYKRPRNGIKANEKVTRAIGTLTATATLTTKALDHLTEQLDSLGYPSTARQGPTRLRDQQDPANPDLDTTGDTACHATNAKALQLELNDTINGVSDGANRLRTLVAKILRAPNDPEDQIPARDGVAVCRDNQHGREGVAEWGDPECVSMAAKSGLCTRDYQRERQWRVTADLADRSEPAA
jgi:hypothetical protein